MAIWDGAELERRTAARMSTAGLVPVLNVVHDETSQEFDIYAFHPRPDGISRVLVQCTTSRPDSGKLTTLRGWADSLSVEHRLFVTGSNPHETQERVADFQGTHFLSEHPDSALHSVTVDECMIDICRPLSLRERLAIGFCRGMSHLRRVALQSRTRHECAEEVVAVWNELDRVTPMRDPFERLDRLYSIHGEHGDLSARCAVAERLGDESDDPLLALKAAYAGNRGTYTQAAMATQTINRMHTFISLCECACLVAGGAQVPSHLMQSGRAGRLVASLSNRPFRHLLGMFVWELLHCWGGMWPAADEALFRRVISDDIGATPQDVDWMVTYCNSFLRSAGQEGYITRVPWQGKEWSNVLLLPYFVKGLGVLRVEALKQARLGRYPWGNWRDDCIRCVQECKKWEREH